jgi:hypothetical protein
MDLNNNCYFLNGSVLCRLREGSNAHFGCYNVDDQYSPRSRTSPGSHMTRLFPFACTSSPGEAAPIMIAPTIRWPNARRRLPAAQRSAPPTHTTLVGRRRRDETVRVIARRTRACWTGPNSYCLQMGLFRQLPVLQLRSVHGDGERY